MGTTVNDLIATPGGAAFSKRGGGAVILRPTVQL